MVMREVERTHGAFLHQDFIFNWLVALETRITHCCCYECAAYMLHLFGNHLSIMIQILESI